MLDNYETFKKKSIDKQVDSSKKRIGNEKNKISGFKKQKNQLKIKKLKNQNQKIQKDINTQKNTAHTDVGGGNYYQ